MTPGKETLSRLTWLFSGLALLLPPPWPGRPGAKAAPPTGTSRTKGVAESPPDPPPGIVNEGSSATISIAGESRADAAEDPPGKAVLDPIRELRRLFADAREQYDAADSYIVRLRRRETIGGKDKPEEVLALKFRKEPWSVHLKWLGAEGKGREAVYVKGHFENKIHTLLADGDMWPLPGGKRMALAPDNPLVTSASRRSITEAGLGELIDTFGRRVENAAHQDERHRSLAYLGRRKRPEFPYSLLAVEHVIATEEEPALAHGGKRMWYFDPKTHLPSLILTFDDKNHVVEYYCYDRCQLGVNLDDEDFNPDKLWGKAK